MTLREDIIRGFENCVFNYCDDNCMYKDEEWKASGYTACRHFVKEATVEIPRRVLFDVLELIKAQELEAKKGWNKRAESEELYGHRS